MKSLAILFAMSLITSLAASTLAQSKPPRSEDYPVHKNDFYQGSAAPLVLNTKRARRYRTLLAQASRKGPNFAGHYTVVTWGAGLGAFSMAVVDSRNGKVYFPPFLEVGDADYQLAGLADVINPAWRLSSRLLAVRGRPDWHGAEGVYLYSFTNNRFRLVYHVDLATWNKLRTESP